MKSFEEAVIGMTGFIMNSQGLAKEAAGEAALAALVKNPAWKDRAK